MLIFGCGYLGQRIAQRWHASGRTVYAVTRSASRAADFEQAGYQALVADVTRPETLTNLPPAKTVLFAVGFDRLAQASVLDVYPVGMRNVLAALPDSVRQLIYISTTGVYGSADGDWVDELTSPNPQRAGGKASFAAEQILAAHPMGVNSIILRLAGIYGPGRIPYQDKLLAGEPIAAPSEGWLNLIHVDDAVSTTLAAAAWNERKTNGSGPHVFCVSDGRPVIRGDYYREVAHQLGARPPQFNAADPSSPAAARAEANKRISNNKMQRMLGVQLAYPSYREGLVGSGIRPKG